MTKRLNPRITDRLHQLNTIAEVTSHLPALPEGKVHWTNDTASMWWDRKDDRWRFCPHALTVERHPTKERLWKVAKIINADGATSDKSEYMQICSVIAFLEGMVQGHRHAWHPER